MQSTESSTSRRRFDLGGQWARFVNGEPWDVVTVPSSLRPSGTYVLKRSILLPALGPNERAFLCFEGLTYYRKAAIHSKHAGAIGAYTPHEIEISRIIHNGENAVEVTVFDLVPWPN